MTIQKALKMVEKEYERAKGIAYIRNPLAWSLYQVWKIADAEPPKEEV